MPGILSLNPTPLCAPTVAVANLPSSATPGSILYCPDAFGGPTLVYGDGTDWRSVMNGELISPGGNGNGGGYPPPIVTAGAEVAYDAVGTAGIQSGSTPDKTPAGNPTELAALGAQISGGFVVIDTSGAWSRWDFTGIPLYIRDAITVSFTNCKMDGTPTFYELVSCDADSVGTGTPTATFTHCEFDGEARQKNFESMIRFYRGALTIEDSLLHKDSLDYITQLSLGMLTLRRNYIRAPGRTAVGPGDHAESVHLRAGNSVIEDNLFDVSDATGTGPYWTGVVSVNSMNGAVVCTMARNILRGMSAVPTGNYTINLTNGGNAATLTLNNNVLQPGTSGYVAKNGVVTLNGTGNLDYDTGTAITLP